MKEKTIIVGHAGVGTLATSLIESVNRDIVVVEKINQLAEPKPFVISAQHFSEIPQYPITRRERREAERKAKKKNKPSDP